MKRQWTAAIIVAFLGGCGSAPPVQTNAGEAVRRLQADVGFLASDALEGRGTPSRGLDLAALYLEAELKKAGALPASDGGYLQKYKVGSYTPSAAKVAVRIDGKTVDAKNYVFVNIGYDPANGALRLPLVEAGNGVVDEEKKVDDFGSVDVKDKAVVAKKGAPWPLDKAAVFGADRAMGKLIAATVRGARLLVYLSPELDTGDEAEAGFFREMKNAGVGFVRPNIGGASALNPMLVLKPEAYPAGAKQIEVAIEAKVEEGTASNVLAKIDGTDAALKDEWVLLTAHYDHIGSHTLPAGQDGIWNGADDNASGTSGVLELARRLARRPGKRSVLLFFTSGEDRGIFGSAFYAANPIVPAEKMAVQFNLDMIGRSQGQAQGVVFGAQTLFDEAVAAGKKRGLEVIPDQQPNWRLVYLTDCYHFARQGVPSLFFFTGVHPDYHQPSDTADKIRYEELAKIVDISEELTRAYVDGKEKPQFTRPVWFRTP
jgi:hypothetical protein